VHGPACAPEALANNVAVINIEMRNCSKITSERMMEAIKTKTHAEHRRSAQRYAAEDGHPQGSPIFFSLSSSQYAGERIHEFSRTAHHFLTRFKFDLIVMPTHAGRFQRALLGSTTARVLSDADCPVLTMQHTAIVGPRSLEHRKWACAIGLSMDSEGVLRYARDAALRVGAKLSVIHETQSRRARQGLDALGREGLQLRPAAAPNTIRRRFSRSQLFCNL
jgi:nucleotide-binding universal stress UspA family protein